MNTNHKNCGFTFVEILTIVAIIGIMTTVVLASLNAPKANSKLKAAQSEVVSAIKLAQSYALQGKVSPGGATPLFYGFKFTDTQAYEIFYVNNGTTDTTERQLEPYSLADKNVSLAQPAFNSVKFKFDVPNGNFDGIPMQLELDYSGYKKHITVSLGGAVTED